MPFDLNAARQAGKTDEEIANYLGNTLGFDVQAAIKAGKTPTQIAEYLAVNERPAEMAAAPPLQTAGPSMAGLQDALSEYDKKSVLSPNKQIRRPALEMGGMLAGGALAAPAGPAGIVAGGSLGYAAGRQAANYLEEKEGLRQPQDIQGRLVEAGKDIPTGAAMEMGGAVLGKGVQELGKLAAPAAERIYASAVKAPLSKKWTEVLPGKELSKRQSGIKAGVEDKVNPSEFGVAKVSQLERETRGMVDDIIGAGSAKGDVVKTEDLITNGLQKAYARAEKSSDPVGAKKIVDEIAEKFRAHGDEIPTQKLNEIKRQIYDEVKWGGSEQTALAGQLTTMGKKGIAHEAMVQLEALYPATRGLNKKDAAYINLKEIIERATARMDNNDLVGIGAKALSTRSLPMAIFEWTVGHPQVKAHLAYALKAAEGITAPNAARITAYTTGKLINGREKPQLIE